MGSPGCVRNMQYVILKFCCATVDLHTQLPLKYWLLSGQHRDSSHNEILPWKVRCCQIFESEVTSLVCVFLTDLCLTHLHDKPANHRRWHHRKKSFSEHPGSRLSHTICWALKDPFRNYLLWKLKQKVRANNADFIFRVRKEPNCLLFLRCSFVRVAVTVKQDFLLHIYQCVNDAELQLFTIFVYKQFVGFNTE